MANEITQKKQEQARLEEVSADSDAQVKEIEKTLTLIENFNEISEKDEPGEVISAIQSILERVYVIREDGREKVKIFIKGAPKENYDSFFEEGVKATIGVDAMCDLDRNRELHPYFCRSTAQGGVQPENEPHEDQIRQGLRTADGRPYADRRLQPAGEKSGPHSRADRAG